MEVSKNKFGECRKLLEKVEVLDLEKRSDLTDKIVFIRCMTLVAYWERRNERSEN